ncbi:nitrous oxide reductase family maturation protein NosD [Actinoplanes sp. N902-109]|uniref:right-handed parallel beta-helix repeat-containing protein n=1 Tax=Actinoplanes sp. (strain N902-109) TaxID=649831 RepID=UPI0003295985|nr:right-handed parallel beta-helix repeat-containing protein [Actinoplanes sp. N902-109]AGL19009.1 hypothetical protein L083_5499 [Actinoplanes sp. N902-109]
MIRPPGGPGTWLGGAALLVALIALVVALTRGGGEPEPGANGQVGASGPVGAGSLPSRSAPTPAPVPSDPTSAPLPTGPVTQPPAQPSAQPVNCPAPTVTVTDAATLTTALAQATPGASIALQDGTYQGTFVAAAKGTADKPISLCGSAGAVIDGGNVKKGYGLHLNGADYWRVSGFTVRNVQKGVMGDGVHHAVISGLTVEQTGDEGIHLRKFSTDNIVENNVVRETGKRRDKFGEGIYIGSANSNWGEISGGQPDTSDRNTVRGNHISATTSESIDVKEGTTGGTISGNTFDGAAITGADSWVDVKGNGWRITGNAGTHSPQDGFQTHSVADGWGTDNTFTGNTAQVDGPGFGFHFAPVEDNRLTCDNKASAAASGLANLPCSN